jgi:glycosyltransferase involved in cell wall biosynthesis
MRSKIHHFAKQLTQEIKNGMVRFASRRRPLFNASVATVAINMYPTFGSWGGSSVFVHQFVAALRRCGFRAVFDLRKGVDIIFMIDPRDDLQNKAFGLDDIKRYRGHHPSVKIIHRINECDKRKNTTFMDDMLRRANDIADHTVFISEWLKEYFIARWFDPARAHTVIYNGADPSVFHPIGSVKYKQDETLRVVTHHWSDNPMKGFPVYEKLDRLIADGGLEGFEFWIIGRWPKEMEWHSAHLLKPAAGQQLADLLRQCHLYLTASLWEPCGMHHVEGAQCGLPLLCHADGGGIVEAAEKYGLIFRDNLKDTLNKARSGYNVLRKNVIENMPSGNRMSNDYVRIVQMLLAEK